MKDLNKKTLQEACNDVRLAYIDFILSIAKATKIDKFTLWLNEKLRVYFEKTK